MKKLYKKIVSLVMSALLAVMVLPVTTHGNRQIMMRPDIKLPQPFASWSNSL